MNRQVDACFCADNGCHWIGSHVVVHNISYNFVQIFVYVDAA